MADSNEDLGVIIAVAQRFEEQRLPRALELKERVEDGEVLNDADVAFLEQVFRDANHMQPLLESRPDLQSVAMQAISLYREITGKALENERNA